MLHFRYRRPQPVDIYVQIWYTMANLTPTASEKVKEIQ